MEVFAAISERRSIRRYKETPVVEGLIRQVLDAGRLAPSWHNGQCWRFLVLSGERKNSLALAVSDENPGKKGIIQAPVAIVICAAPGESGTRDGKSYYLADAGIAFENICLAAWELGLGTCWVGSFEEEALKQILDIPSDIRVAGMTPLGYPDQTPRARPRKELSEIAFSNIWGNPFPQKAKVMDSLAE